VVRQQPIRAWARDTNYDFMKKVYSRQTTTCKRCSTSSDSKEMQIKSTVKSHYTPLKMVKIKNNADTK
jgi:hypothetical protein